MNSSGTGESDFSSFVFFGGIVLFMASVWWIKDSSGADFWAVVISIILSIVVFTLASAVVYFQIVPLYVGLSAGLFFMWPCWWLTINSMAKNTMPSFLPASYYPWWASWWFKWGVLAALSAVFIGCLYKMFSYR